MSDPDYPTNRATQVFVVHGRNTDARQAMFEFLRAIGIRPIEWSQARSLTNEGSPYIATILDAAFETAQAVIVLFTPDEVVKLRPEFADGVSDPDISPEMQARPNVLFEAGMAMGRDASRTVLVELGKMRGFSDILGRHAIRMSDDPSTRLDLAQRLQSAGCAVDLSGSDWLRSGNFEAAIDLKRPELAKPKSVDDTGPLPRSGTPTKKRRMIR